MKFIDIHCHVLSQFDDGAKSDEISRTLLTNAAKEGVSDVICTPHFMIKKKYKKNYEETQNAFNSFKERMKDIPVHLHLGNEIEVDESTDEYLEHTNVHTLAGSSYVLVEMPSWITYSDEVDDYLYNIKLLGYKIIIAHPERYDYVQKDYRFCKRWIDEGYYLQMNQNSLFSKERKQLSLKLVQENYISFIASDAHHENRAIELKDCYEYIVSKCGEAKANALFYDNAKCILENKEIAVNKIQEKRGLLKFLSIMEEVYETRYSG